MKELHTLIIMRGERNGSFLDSGYEEESRGLALYIIYAKCAQSVSEDVNYYKQNFR